jgi:hypothetical protein
VRKSIPKSSQTAILDTNLVLLWLVAKSDPGLLARYKRVQMFTDRDIPLLDQMLGSFQRNLTTPQVLTEVSNFLGQAPPYAQQQLKSTFAEYISARQEIYVRSADLATHRVFLELGLTDCSLEDASFQHTIITTDYRLTGKIVSMGGRALNFNHARAGYLLPNG